MDRNRLEQLEPAPSPMTIEEVLRFIQEQEHQVQDQLQLLVNDLLAIGNDNARFFEQLRQRVENNHALVGEITHNIAGMRARMAEIFGAAQ
jgi:uncharacterized membrane protein